MITISKSYSVSHKLEVTDYANGHSVTAAAINFTIANINGQSLGILKTRSGTSNTVIRKLDE